MALQGFPPEILVEIFSNLRLRDLFACDGTCRVFHQLFTDSSYLEYRIELEKTGMIDNPYCQLPTRLKVEMLRERESAWSTFRWKFHKTKKVPSTASTVYGLSADELFLGIEGGTQEFETTGIQHLKLPSIVGAKVTSSPWRCLDFGEEILEFGSAASEHDLLVLSRISPPNDDHPLSEILIDFRHYSDPKKPHKSASTPVISVRFAYEWQGTPVLGIEIAGENMTALIMSPGDNVSLLARLYIFNWMLGVEKTVDPYITYCENVIFLRDDLLLVPDSNSCALHLYQIPSSSSRTHIRLIQTLNLPALKSSAELTSCYLHSAPQPTDRSAFPSHFPHSKPFLSEPESAIITFSFAVSSDQNLEDTEYTCMVVHKKSLVDLVPLNVDEFEGANTPSLPWESWGPSITRWFITNEILADFTINSCGQRYVECMPSIFVNPRTGEAPCVITLYDFNPWRVKYVRHHQDQILDLVAKHPNLVQIQSSREETTSNHSTQLRNEDGDQEELLKDVCITNKFASNIVGRLPCVAYRSINWPEYDGLLIDDERLIGIYTEETEEDTYRVTRLDITYFG